VRRRVIATALGLLLRGGWLRGGVTVQLGPWHSAPSLENRRLKSWLRANPRSARLALNGFALFGSVLRGDARPDSDVDLLVQFSPGAKTFDRFLSLSELLEVRLGRRVELVTTEALSPFIGPRILAEAQDVLRAA